MGITEEVGASQMRNISSPKQARGYLRRQTIDSVTSTINRST